MKRPHVNAIGVAGPCLALMLAGCSSKPSATNVTWKVERTADKKAYHLIGGVTYARGLSGWYIPLVTLTDDRGCKTDLDVASTQIADRGSTGTVDAKFDATVKLAHPVATADMVIHYGEPSSEESTGFKTAEVYSGTQVLDATLHPPDMPVKPCHRPLTADEKLDQMPRNMQVAVAIRSAGFTCQRVTDLYPDSAGQIIAHCVKYASGRGAATYKIDADAGQVEVVE